ncbi:MAG: Ribonuclease [candidate division WS6 bacterium OLB20]|uniref:Ribonuclease n=1 Tax=candidate division WS6 bacterium OLB20 TaxID=1617426 RepID=A0A136LY97_9BACT|nr:MAG: Ribonuclease [candidate division WS6 bacterium OLB20]
MFQGPDVEDRNKEPFGFVPSEIDFVILTHAHMDHCGLIPRLVREGFAGPIYMTPPTAALSELVLLDSAKIQELEAKKQGTFEYSEAMPYTLPGILYDTRDAMKSLTMFRTEIFGKDFQPAEGITVRFVPAGHILGAASVQITISGRQLLFSGDIGRADQTIINTFSNGTSFSPEYITMESLYGGIEHPDRNETLNELISVITKTTERDGNVIIPCFAIHRTQELLEILSIAFDQGRINGDVQVYIDSPMAIRATKIYTQFSGYFNDRTDHFGVITEYSAENSRKPRTAKRQSNRRFDFDQLRYIRTHKKSLRLASATKSIIIAGSGMAEGGRIMHHIASHAPDTNSSLVFVGFQAEQTTGRSLVDGASQISINKKDVQVRAGVHYLRGFSAHADSPTLQQWLSLYDLKRLKQAFLVHAEPERSEALASILTNDGVPAHIPDWKQSITL